jgi:flagellin
MSRINTNLGSLQALHNLQRNQDDLSLHLQRLSTGLQINTGKDAPAGLIASEQMRSEINGINQAIDNSQRADNVMNTAEGALNEISAQLLEVQSLTSQAANTGALSPDEIKANQLQVDAILNSINRIADTTQFNGQKLLNGSLDYTTSGLNTNNIATANIYAARTPDNGQTNVTVQVTASAKLATIGFTASGVGTTPTTIEIAGNLGTTQLSFAASAHNSAIAVSINQFRAVTGVSAVLSGAALKITSTDYGSRQFVSVKTISGTFNTTANRTSGTDASVNINGTSASVDGLNASLRAGNTDIELRLSAAFAQQTHSADSFYITGGGAKFQLGSEVNATGQTQVGIQSVSTTKLGNSVDGYLSSMLSGQPNSLVSGNTTAAQKIITDAINQVAVLRGRIGAFQKDVLDANVNSLNVALENVTASESQIRDADFASETAALTRAQILVQANTSVLSQANSAPQSVLTLLGR